MTLARLMVLLQLNSTGFQAGLLQAQQQLAAFNRSLAGMSAGANLQSIGRGLTYGLTIPILAAAVAIGAAGNNLTSEMARVQSVIATPGNMQSSTIARWTDDVQRLGVELGRTSPEVAGGLYEIVSAFGNVGNATEFLRIAGRAAVAGQSDIVQSTKNLVLATRAWGDSSTDAVQRMADLASATVRIGTLTESELGPAMAGLLPIMRLYGVRLEDGFAGLASLAGVTGSASQASTQLQRAITSLVAPNTTMLKLYKQFGIESGETLIAQRGLVGAFEEIKRISEATGTPLQKMLGRIEGLKAIATLTDTQLDAFNTNLEALADAAGSVDTAFSGATQGVDKAGFQWAVAIQRLRVMAEDLYIAFAPAAANVAAALSPIGGALESVAQSVAEMDVDTLTTVVYVLLGLALLGPVVSIVGGLVTTFSGLSSVLALANPWVLAIGVAGAALWLAWNKDWGGIQGGVYSFMDNIRQRADNTRQAIENLQQTWEKFNNPQAKAAGGATNGPAATLRDVVKAAGEVVVAMGPPKQKLTEFQQAMIDQAPKVQGAWDIFWGGFADNMPDFSQMGADIGALWSSITSGAQGAGVGISSGISPAVMGVGRNFGTMASDAAREMNKIPPSARGAANGAKSAFTSVGWGSLGSSIASGIAQGITSGASWIAAAARSAASSALSAAKSALGINSPSRVFRDSVGYQISSGLALGIYDGAGLVNSAMSRLVTPPALAYAGGGYGGVRVKGGGESGGPTTTTENNYYIQVTAVPGVTQADGERFGMGFSQALRQRGMWP